MGRTAQLTRDRILDAARELFVASGTAAVSTNHVAAAVGISPGNLYYHFGNKEEIVAALLDRTADRLNEAWPESHAFEQAELAAFEAVVERSFRVLAEFSFFTRELFALCLAMPSVAERERKLRDARVATLHAALSAMVAARALRDPGPARLRELADLSWLLGFAAMARVEESAETSEQAARRATRAVMVLVSPYALN